MTKIFINKDLKVKNNVNNDFPKGNLGATIVSSTSTSLYLPNNEQIKCTRDCLLKIYPFVLNF